MELKPLKIPIQRNRDRGGIDLCIPALAKWIFGLAGLAFPAATALLWTMNASIAAMASTMHAIEQRLEGVEDKMESVREDPFTGDDGKELQREVMGEIRRHHP